LNTSTDNLSITLKPSNAVIICLGSLHLLALIVVVLLSIAAWLKALLLILVVAMATKAIREHGLNISETSITKLSCASNSKCRIELNNGTAIQAKITNADWLFNYFAVLIIQSKQNKFNTVIAKDSLSQEQFYTLRLYLRSLNK